ncbi:MAG: DUF1800 domain-containing protein [Thermomonas sp.]|uniref:DUF1800 domain-containing protein n=1 Tax=Thermomonas sp. TaxID=1971895 RepID=UPI0039E3862E
MKRSIGFAAAALLALGLAACGGGGGSSATTSPGTGTGTGTTPTPTPVSDKPTTDAEAARFLTQATFGPTKTDIARVREIGYGAWIDEQLDPARTPITLIEPHILSIPVASLNYAERRNYWLWQAASAKDQLRLRMGFALSEIFVVSDRDYNTANFGRISNYQDMLDTSAFDTYRAVIEKVTLHPAMGLYLSHLANRKAVSYKNSQGITINIVPDENYARELMQLFSIGLEQRNSDFSLKLDSAGKPIPTYDQTVVAGMARVLTGWTWHGNTKDTFWKWGADNETRPMSCVPEMHDDQPKTIFNGIVINEGNNCTASLAKMLDALAAHQNTAPFISRQLIQRFVTSNPSPAYIGRVVTAWNQNSGNLGKVIRAILLDKEARTAPAASDVTYGKAREPLIQLTTLWRAFDAKYLPRADGQYRFNFSAYWDFSTTLAQDSLRSPSVFNFFSPDEQLPAAGGGQGIYAPEFQLYNDATFASIFNQLCYAGCSNFKSDAPTANTDAPVLDVKPLLTLADAGNHAGMVDAISPLLFGGALSAQTRTTMIDMLDKLKAANRSSQERVQSLVQLALASPEFVVQR